MSSVAAFIPSSFAAQMAADTPIGAGQQVTLCQVDLGAGTYLVEALATVNNGAAAQTLTPILNAHYDDGFGGFFGGGGSMDCAANGHVQVQARGKLVLVSPATVEWQIYAPAACTAIAVDPVVSGPCAWLFATRIA